MPSNIQVHRNDSAELRDHVECYHYLHRWPAPLSLPFGYTLEVDGKRHQRDGRLSGLVVMKKPQHNKQAGLFGYPGLPTAWQILDLARVWIHPDLQRPGLCVFSQMVSQVLRRVQQDWLEHHPPYYPDLPYDVLLIISYCELAHHDGTSYRASGFTRLGLTDDGTKELYCRRLQAPRKAWRPSRPCMKPLFVDLGLPLIHGRP
jgi:hypothetical protein